jgi:hypothetical protein
MSLCCACLTWMVLPPLFPEYVQLAFLSEESFSWISLSIYLLFGSMLRDTIHDR